MAADPGPALLRRLRRERGFSQQRLADVCGVSDRTIRGLERGAVRTPRASSLRALAAGLDLDPASRAALVRGWASVRRIETLDELSPRTDIMQFLKEASVQAANELHTVSFTRRTTVGTDRRVRWDEDSFVLRAKADDVRRMLCVSTNSGAVDVADTRLDRLRGCRLAARHYSAERGLAAYELAFPVPLARDQSHPVSYRIGVDPDHRDVSSSGRTLEPSDGFACGTRSSMGVMCLTVTFETPPSAVYALAGAPATRAEDLRLGPDQSVTVLHENVDAGTYGIGWDWD